MKRKKESDLPTNQQGAVQTQSERFIQAARELGCDESEERFIETVRKIAKAPPTPHPKPPSKKKTRRTANTKSRCG